MRWKRETVVFRDGSSGLKICFSIQIILAQKGCAVSLNSVLTSMDPDLTKATIDAKQESAR